MSEVVLVVDAMSLHKATMWGPISNQYVGNVDYGTAVPEVCTDLATDALVFMIVGLSGHFKHPTGYVLYIKLTASVQAQLIKDYISLLHAVGLHVFALVFDGHFTNQCTAKLLGCKMKVAEIMLWFPHPNLPGSKIFVVLDVCHMIKLMRNLLGDYKVICHEDDDHPEKIKWQYIEQLNAVQDDLGFSFANKLKRNHILWQKHKMKVSIAAQTLCASVAHALDFLRVGMAVDTFAGCKPTSDFIQDVDELFDFLNSRNTLPIGTKLLSHYKTSTCSVRNVMPLQNKPLP